MSAYGNHTRSSSATPSGLLVLIGPGRSDDPVLANDGTFERVVSLEEVAASVRTGAFLRDLVKWPRVVGLCEDLRALPRPFVLESLLRLSSRGVVVLVDRKGQRRRIGANVVPSALGLLAELATLRRDRTRMDARLRRLEQLASSRRAKVARSFEDARSILLFRTDLWLGVKSGGSVAHTAGISNAMAELGRRTVLAGLEENPILAPDVAWQPMPLPSRYWHLPRHLPALANLELEASCARVIETHEPDLVYHRLASKSFAAALAAKERNLPLIVEYNGSEAWISRNWGTGDRDHDLALRIENAVLASADRIVAVSKPLEQELLARGVERDRIVVQMNGVDTQAFRPDIDGTPVRDSLGFESDDIVIGFIGTFGMWHGAPVLAEAFSHLVKEAPPEVRARLRLLLVGDGPERSLTAARLTEAEVLEKVRLVGLVPQREAPRYLAACDILAAPHVPNHDGSEFFGSPTKLFEYMSMGRAIVASNLGQIGEVLEHEVTGLLVSPGDRVQLAHALMRLATNEPLRAQLALGAQKVALENHSWAIAAKRILR